MAFKITEDCIACGACADECPVGAISEGDGKYEIDADACIDCGSCAGGKRKTVFGKAFDGVCGCTFRIDNPTEKEIPFLKQMVIIRKNEIAKFNM